MGGDDLEQVTETDDRRACNLAVVAELPRAHVVANGRLRDAKVAVGPDELSGFLHAEQTVTCLTQQPVTTLGDVVGHSTDALRLASRGLCIDVCKAGDFPSLLIRRGHQALTEILPVRRPV